MIILLGLKFGYWRVGIEVENLSLGSKFGRGLFKVMGLIFFGSVSFRVGDCSLLYPAVGHA